MNRALLDEWLALAWPGRLPALPDRHRAQALVLRVRAFAIAFAWLTLAWIPLDALILDPSRLALLTAARLVDAALFGLLAISCRLRASTLGQARIRIAAFFLIHCALFLFSQEILPAMPAPGWPRGIESAYSFFPFMLAAGIGAFPLAIAESVPLAALLFGVEAAALASDGLMRQLGGLELLWLLFLIAGAGGFAAASQLKLLVSLIEQAVRDPLTGCLRRESGAELLEMQFSLARRRNAPLAVLFADLDRFKAVNDAFGHEAGDRVLATAATALREIARDSDVVIRWGGEEFVMVLPETTSTDAVTLIQRLRAGTLGAFPDGRPTTVSIGVAESRADGAPDAAELVALADHRMYLAKQAGRDRYVIDGSGEAYPIVGSRTPATAASTVSR
ncbi:MAG: diguanylate cyclase [Usitatibacter sp.]